MTSYSPSTRAADIAVQWWEQTHKQQGAFARIRRARTLLEIVQEPAALELIRRLPHENRRRLAVLAGVLAWVRETNTVSVARGYAAVRRASQSQQPDDKKPLDIRFRRLIRLQANEPESLLRRLRRLVRHLKGTANVRDLAYSVLRWGDPVKQRWIFDFHNVPLEPAATDKEPEAPQA